MELVSHVAKEHHQEDHEWNVEFHRTPKGGQDNKNSSLMITQAELDKDLKLVQGFGGHKDT